MFDSLPVIIVTAKTKTAAAEIVSELIDNEVTAEAQAQARGAADESGDRVWRLHNKYYCADVRVHARAESDAPHAHAGPVGAHLVLLASDEVQAGAELAARRLQRAAWLGAPAAVRVVACDSAAVPEAVAAECAARRAESVALREPPPAVPEPFGARGADAVRAALHAHAWPGLRRHTSADRAEDALGEAGFAAALATLSEAGARCTALQGAARRTAAERLVAQFAAAIGQPLDELDDDEAALP